MFQVALAPIEHALSVDVIIRLIGGLGIVRFFRGNAMKDKPVIKALLFSLIASVGLTAIGLVINLISYHISGDFLFCRHLTGGEWMGQEGFGLLLNETFPLTVDGYTYGSSRTWIEFAPDSLIKCLFMFYVIAVAILLPTFLIIHKIKKDRPT